MNWDRKPQKLNEIIHPLLNNYQEYNEKTFEEVKTDMLHLVKIYNGCLD